MSLTDANYIESLKKCTLPLRAEKDMDSLIQMLGDKKIVMLGESSHGTKEFYQWRSLITQELISKHDFKFIAVEGDWPACQYVQSYIDGEGEDFPQKVLGHFDRWPTWMWANTEMSEFIHWLRAHNSDFKKEIGFHGLDVYSLFESMDHAMKGLRKIDPALAVKAENYYSCLNSYSRDEMSYSRSLFKAPEGCKQQILDALQIILEGRMKDEGAHKKDYLNIIQNAKIVRNAEQYYRAMLFGEESSWNVRDNHMLETLEFLLEHYGTDSKVIIWAHNSHIGDYRATDMTVRGEVNLGGLAREIFGDKHVALVGFGTHSGTVLASEAWNGVPEIFSLPQGKAGSLEDAYHQLSKELSSKNLMTIFKSDAKDYELSIPRGHRAVGVVYDPAGDYRRNYVPTSLNNRYDAFLFFDETHSLSPLGAEFSHHKFPETYPFGNRV